MWMISLKADTNPGIAAVLLRNRGIRHHFRGNPLNGRPNYRGFAAYSTSVPADFPRLDIKASLQSVNWTHELNRIYRTTLRELQLK